MSQAEKTGSLQLCFSWDYRSQVTDSKGPPYRPCRVVSKMSLSSPGGGTVLACREELAKRGAKKVASLAKSVRFRA